MSDAWLPEVNELNAPFFEGAREGVLRLQRCGGCGSWTFPRKQKCQHCGSDRMEWADASGKGILFSHALLRRVYHPRHEGRLPIHLAQVDLPEGVRMSTNIVNTDKKTIKVGMPLEVVFEEFDDGGVIPVFQPSTDD